ncbi:hypothetical protein BVY02_02330, partial [bacterium J17]
MRRNSKRDTQEKRSRFEKEKFKSVAPRVLKLALPYKKALGFGFIALCLASGINLLFPYLIRLALNEQIGFQLDKDLSKLTFLLIFLFALQASLFYLRHYFFWSVGYRVVATLKKRLYEAMINQDIAFFDSSRTGDLLNRLSADTELVKQAVTVNISVALRYILQVIGGV